MPNSILVVNMRGTVNVRKPVKATLEDLHINKRFRATIVPDNPIYRGMLKLAKDRVAWSTVEPSLVTKLLELRGRKDGWKPLEKNDVQKLLQLIKDCYTLQQHLNQKAPFHHLNKSLQHYNHNQCLKFL